MNPRTTLTYGCLLLSVIFVACHKDSTAPTTPPTPPTAGTMNINLVYPYGNDTSTVTYELIISEPAGKVLLDTVAIVNTPVKAVLKTNAHLVDVTTVRQISEPGLIPYAVEANLSVDPSGWTTVTKSGYSISTSPHPAYSDAQLQVQNFPATAISYGANIFSSYIFDNGPNPAGSFSTYSGNTINITYQRQNGLYNYFAAPGFGPGLYKLWIPASDNEIVDCNHLDTLVPLRFTRTSQVTLDLGNSQLLGVPDTTNFPGSIGLLSGYSPLIFPNADLMFPKEPMQKYELFLNATNSLNDYVSYYSYANTIPTTPVFVDPASFSVTSTQNDNFSVSFAGAKPTYCETGWVNAKMALTTFSSPDSATIHPLTLLNIQKSKMLGGIGLSDLKLQQFIFENIPELTYSSYFSYMSDPSMRKTKRIRTASMFIRVFK